MNIKGKARLNTTAEGLRNIDLKLALAMANVALVLLYGLLLVIRSFVHFCPTLSKGEGGRSVSFI
jgi:hypothetical protein